VKGGSVRAVAITGKKRSALAPDVPTMIELGLPQLDFGAWWAMWGPPATPVGLVRTLNGLVNEAVMALAEEGRLKALSIEPAARSPEEFTQYLRVDLDRSEKLLRGANFTPQ
jgi:tripartite-type tricarboxylate transporter receptor subunit TctC